MFDAIASNPLVSIALPQPTVDTASFGVAESLRQLQVIRYFALAGLTLYVYDSLLMFPHELVHIWSPASKSNKAFRALFIISKYGILTSTVLFFCMFIMPVGKMSDQRCIISSAISIFLDITLCVCGDGLLVYILCSSWHRRKVITSLLCGGMISGYVGALVYMVICIHRIIDQQLLFVAHVGTVRSCALSDEPTAFISVFPFFAAMELFFLLFFVANVLSTPRMASEGLMGIMLKDGLTFFLVNFSKKISNVIVVTRAPMMIAVPYPAFSVILISCSTARVFLRYCATKEELRRQQVVLR